MEHNMTGAVLSRKIVNVLTHVSFFNHVVHQRGSDTKRAFIQKVIKEKIK